MECSNCYRYDIDSRACEQPELVECDSRPADDSCQVGLAADSIKVCNRLAVDVARQLSGTGFAADSEECGNLPTSCNKYG
jgi:hypothetical protein